MATSTNSRPRAAKARIGNSAAIDSAADARDSAEKNPAAPAAPVSAALSAIERVRLARNPSRPQTLDYVEHLVRDFFEIHGDRRFADDGAIVAGMGYFGRRAVAIVGHQALAGGPECPIDLRRSLAPALKGILKMCERQSGVGA